MEKYLQNPGDHDATKSENKSHKHVIVPNII